MTMEERFILESLQSIQTSIGELSREVGEIKTSQTNLREAWDKACVVSEISDLKHMGKENSSRIDAIEMRRRKPIAFITGILGSVIGSVLTLIFGKIISKR